jgi:hypothetical protein
MEKRLHLPDVFDGTQYLVGEIEGAIIAARAAASSMAAQRMCRSLDGMQRAQAQLDTLLRQCTSMSAALASVMEFHAKQSGRAP